LPEEVVMTLLWWFGHASIILLSIVCIFIGWRVISMPVRDYINFILSLTLLLVGVILLIYSVDSIGGRIRGKARDK
jgi:NADH:ubiquinone oxidoreductase subunit K